MQCNPKLTYEKSMSLERGSLTTISFFCGQQRGCSLLKKETLHNNDYQNINEYANGVFCWIWFYKTERISLSERHTI